MNTWELSKPQDAPCIFFMNPEKFQRVKFEFPFKIDKFDMVVIDEVSKFKDSQNLRSKNLQAITKNCEYVMGMTATPYCGNDIRSLFSQIHVINFGYVSKNLTGFIHEYMYYPTSPFALGRPPVPLAVNGADVLLRKKIDEITVRIKGYETKGTELINIKVTLSSEQLEFYDALRNSDNTLPSGLGNFTSLSQVKFQKLSQITAGGLYLNNSDNPLLFHNEKWDHIQKIIKESQGGVIICYTYKFELLMIAEKLPNAVVLSSSIVDQWNKGEIPILVANSKSGGHGLNLQFGGHTIIWLSLPQSVEDYYQMCHRLDRRGQQHVVKNYVLSFSSTVEWSTFNKIKRGIIINEQWMRSEDE